MVKDTTDRAPLHWASGRGHSDIVARLLRAPVGFDTAILADSTNRTPSQLARQLGHVNIDDEIERFIVNVEATLAEEAGK